MQEKFSLNFYKCVRKILNRPIKLIFNPKITGIENIPSKPYVLAGNHKSLLDIPLLAIALEDDIHFMAKKELFRNSLARHFLEKCGAFPVDRQSFDLNAIKTALRLLKSENVVGIFPEGTRNKTNDLILPFKDGVTSIASKTKSLIVPFGIGGEYKFRGDLSLNIGEPIDIRNIEKEKQTEYLEDKVKELILKR